MVVEGFFLFFLPDFTFLSDTIIYVSGLCRGTQIFCNIMWPSSSQSPPPLFKKPCPVRETFLFVCFYMLAVSYWDAFYIIIIISAHVSKHWKYWKDNPLQSFQLICWCRTEYGCCENLVSDITWKWGGSSVSYLGPESCVASLYSSSAWPSKRSFPMLCILLLMAVILAHMPWYYVWKQMFT